MPLRKKLMIILVLIIAIFALLFSPYLIKNDSPKLGSVGILIGGFIFFVALLEVKLDRVLKGFYLIFYGVLFKTAYPFLLGKYIPLDTLTIDFNMQIGMYGDVVLLACSGAGGSIIANYADKSSLDYENVATTPTTPDNTRDIKTIMQSIESLNSKINTIITACFFTILVFLIALIIILAR